MDYEIIEAPLCLTLHGIGGRIDERPVTIVGKRLMDAMWQEVQTHSVKAKGLNHWVYLPNSEMFVGVELGDDLVNGIGTLEKFEVRLPRYLQYLHRGPYSTLPEIWPKLFAILEQIEEHPLLPNLELYGHWNPDPTQCETTILIGLTPKR